MAMKAKKKAAAKAKPVAKKAAAKPAPKKATAKPKGEEISSDLRKVALAHALRRLR